MPATKLVRAMSDTRHVKCSCQKCGGHIEFPEAGVGVTIDCPHCGKKTTLCAPVPIPAVDSRRQSPANSPGPGESGAPPKKKSLTALVSVLSLIILIVAGAAAYVAMSKKKTAAGPPPASPAPPAENKPLPATASAAASGETNHFHISPVSLEKSESGGLVYAVGTVRNDTDRQRFGVKIELDLMDKQGDRIGSASDYIAVLEPRKEWRFRALLTETKVSGAKVAGIGERE
jgi:hypothetical protein